MNRKFIVSGLIIKQLMIAKRVNAIELAEKLGKTRTAIYLIQKRNEIKGADAVKILDALGYTLNEVEEMDDNGLFSGKDSYIPTIENSEMEYFKELLNKTEKTFNEINKKLTERNQLLEETLISKDNQISTLISLLGGAR